MHGAKGRGVHRHTRWGQVVIAHRLHAHHRKQAANGGQLIRRAQADGTVAFEVQALDFAGALQLLRQLRLGVEYVGIGLGHQLHQGAIQGNFISVHVGHGLGKAPTDLVGADMCGAGHRKIPDGYSGRGGLCLDFVERKAPLQTKIPQDFILQMNEMT